MKLIHLVLPLLCAVMISCGTSSSPLEIAQNQAKDIVLPQKTKENMEPDKPFATGTADTASIPKETVYQNAPPVIDWEKKIIKTANIEAECKDYVSYNRSMHFIVKQYGGWVAAESETQENGRISNSVSIKVPVQKFEELINSIGSTDGKVLKKSITTEDVTGNIVDAEGRVRVKKAMRDKYLIMLTQATKMEDVLNVQSKIDEIHEGIEMNATNLESLKHQAAYSTVNINYYQPVATDIASDKTPGFASRILAAAKGGAFWIGDLMVAIISIWPLLLVAMIMIYFIKIKITHAAVVKSNKSQV